MSDNNKILAYLKDLIKGEVKLAMETLDNGAATLEAEVFEAGQPVMIVNEDERIPLPIGEYPLDSGMILVVAEEGIISEMKEAQSEEEEVVEEEVAASNEPTETPLPKSVIESVVKETKFSADEVPSDVLDFFNGLIDAKLAELNKVEEPVAEEVEEVELSAEEPAKPIVHNPEVKEVIKMNKIGKKAPKSVKHSVMSKIANL